MSKGNPPIPVRMTPEHRDRWQAAASKAGLDFTTWVRQSLDIAAGFTPGRQARVPTSDADDPSAMRYQYRAPEAQTVTTGTHTSAAVASGALPSSQAEAEGRRILDQYQSGAGLDLPPIPQPNTTDCDHPKKERQPKSYGTLCGVCGHLVQLKGAP